MYGYETWYNSNGDFMSKCKKCIFVENELNICFAKGTVIFNEGEEVSNIYSIIDGIVKITKLYPNGEERLIDILNNGDFLALLTILNDSKEYMVTATALTEVTLVSSSYSFVMKQYQNNINFMNTCMRCASNRLSIFQKQLFDFSGQDNKENIMNLLKYLYGKFGYIKDGEQFLKLPMTKIDLANMLGLRRETLYRKLKELQDDGIITIKNNLIKFTNM